VAKVRCRSCYFDHDYLREQAPPSKKDLKKAELFNAVLSTVDPSTVPESPSETRPDEPGAGNSEKAATKKTRGGVKKA
jgi:hypothetical protein